MTSVVFSKVLLRFRGPCRALINLDIIQKGRATTDIRYAIHPQNDKEPGTATLTYPGLAYPTIVCIYLHTNNAAQTHRMKA